MWGRRLAQFAVATTVAALSLVFAASAFAGPSTFSWSAETPAPGASLQAKAGIVTVTVAGSNTLNARTGQLSVDGVAYTTTRTNPASTNGYWKLTEYWDAAEEMWVTDWVWTMSPDLTKVKLSTYAPGGPLGKDGTHTVVATIKDATGVSASETWTFGVHIKPVLGAPTPAAGSTVATCAPQISIPVSDNDGVARWDATVNGAAAAASLSAGVLHITPASALANDANATVSVTVYDADNNADSTTWSFGIQTYPEMFGTTTGCPSCHPGYEYDPDMNANCSQCHAGLDAPHVGTPSQLHARADVSACSGCHVSSLSVEHARRKDAGGTSLTCATCHRSTNPDVVAAISAGNTACTACHVSFSHYGSIDHTATPAPQTISISGTSYGSHACNECHSMRLGDVHSLAGAPDCGTCHPSPRSSFATWDFGCVQGDCHAGASPKPMHANVDAAHAFPAARTDCLASGCHDAGAMTPFAGKTLAQIHSAASTTTSGGQVRTSCQICHAIGVTPASNCLTAGCHPDRASAHGYDAAKHISSETCFVGCHSTELKPAHAAQVTAKTVVCSDCHATLVASIKPWDKSCSACHQVIKHASANHTGSDAAVRVDRSGFGCSSTAPTQTDCHDIANISALHTPLPDKGCPLCHGAGKTPTNDCRACHNKNDPITSQAGVDTRYPTADGPLVGTAVNSAGATRWDKVDDPASDSDATYFQFTSAGSAMFSAPQSIPTSATIQSVVVYAYARTGAASPLRAFYPMVTVGGTQYQYSAKNVGLAYQLSSYSLTTNPKTGAAWTPAQLNATGGASTLDYIGVGTSNATADATGYLRVTQCYVKVNYTVPVAVPAGTLLGGSWYHHNNVKYIADRTDAAPGAFYYPDAWPPHGWYDALFYQDCYDRCHVGYVGYSGAATSNFSAQQGSWMWYSVGGDPWASPLERILTLNAITIPASSPTLTFQTNYDMGGATGYVEISTNGGTSWTPLTGTVGGTSMSTITGTATGWAQATYNLSAYAGQSAKLRFRYENGNSTSAGWGFDSLTIGGSSGPVFSDDAETLKPDWTNTYWTRAHKAFPMI
jgi:hypothetical protein